MPNDIAHFAIHAEDCARAKRFYESVFEWSFEAWGPPNFWLIHTSEGAAIRGALQERQAPIEGDGMSGYECTIAVEDLGAIAASIEAHGGTLLSEPFEITGVGTLIMFRDTEGNRVGAMQYVDGIR